MSILQAITTERPSPRSRPVEQAQAEPAAREPWVLPWWAFGLSLILMMLPVLLSSGLPSWDYSMHATRASVIVRQSLPLFRDVFHYRLVPLPNLAVDLVVPFLATFMPVAVANKVFLLLTLLLQATGAAAVVVAVQKRLTPVSLLIPLACYNIIVGWGFTGYLFSIGIAMWGFAAYILLRPGPLPLRTGVLTLFAVTTYFGHLAAFGLMFVSILIFEAVEFLKTRPRPKRAVRSAAIALLLAGIIPGFVHVFLSPVGQSVGTRYAPPVFWFTDLIMVLNPYRTRGLSILTIAVVLCVAVMLIGRYVKVDKVLGWTSLCLLGVYLATPHELYGSWYANTRLIPWVALVFLTSLRVHKPGRRVAFGVGACGLALLMAQATLLLRLWSPWDQERLDLMAAAREAPPGTMFVSLEQTVPQKPRGDFVQRVTTAAWQDDPDWHPPTYHIVDEVALQGEYLPIQFTLLPGKQPLEYDAKYLDLYLRFNSSWWDHIAPIDRLRYLAMPEVKRRQLLPNLAFAPLHVNSNTMANLRQLLVLADGEYRQIRRDSCIYPSAGIYVVYIHRWSKTAPNPFPDLFREVHAGKLYSVYELRTGALG